MARDKSASSNAPKTKKVRWYHQLWQAYQMTRETDPAVTWVIVGAFVVVLGIGVIVGLLLDSVVYFILLSLPFALLAAMFLLARRAEAAAYSRIEGQPGAALAALRTLRRGWTFVEEPVAIDPRSQDMVFRGVGRPGVVLVGEGTGNVARLLEAERKRTSRVLPSVPVTVIVSGRGEGQVPLRKLPVAVRKLKPKLTKPEVAEVTKRLQALGGARLPVPKGIDPLRMRPDRKGMRGR
ncbi:DUF4191 domain-containing protein [Cellulomonas palmilytica]|uniref:DUF4191 domain-containing protein n=1 Tax=Cellulomonas palmilytica TaxID=2608402 RepID=UPI001F39B976|nr:DUF4191 domain-containing protein [Cellulomonas palmilytica]UJP39249.1 DUF4191 domain-containing protein [Cellulomonas palmilytica]